MSKSLQEILGYLTLTGTIQATTPVPNPFPPALFKETKKCIGPKGRYTRVTAERRPSRLSKYGAASREADLRDVGEVDAKLLHTIEGQPLDPLIMTQLRSKNAYEQDIAIDEVKRQVMEFKRKFDVLEIIAVAQVLRNGILYWDAKGNILPTSAGAKESHDFQLNADNKNQLNGIITQSWANPSTDIPLQLRNLRKRSRRLTGQKLKYAFYGENVPSYLTTNSFVLDFMARNDKMNPEWLADGEIPSNLFGFTWVPVYEAFYEDTAGVNQDLWDADAVVFAPEISEEWWDWLVGSYEVPTTLTIHTDATAAMQSLTTVFGKFAYGTVTVDPIGVKTIQGNTFLPALKLPDAIFSADVTP